jgi:hypothetical protein
MNEIIRPTTAEQNTATANAIAGAFSAIASTISSLPHAVRAEEWEEMNKMDGELISSDWFVERLGRALEATPGIVRIQ